ncbi:MAG: PilZ domain-containing protein [Thiogranum sp.]
MRSYIRHPSDIPIEYQADERNTGISQEHLHDISAAGLSFSSTHSLDPGSLITIRISCVQPGFEARAQVVWCHRDSEGFVTGVVFIEPGDFYRARMVEQICHIEHYRAEVLANEGRRLDGEQAAHEWIQKFAVDFPGLEDDGKS